MSGRNVLKKSAVEGRHRNSRMYVGTYITREAGAQKPFTGSNAEKGSSLVTLLFTCLPREETRTD